MVIGEAAAQLDAALKARTPQVPWQDIIRFRNIIVHSYFRVSWPLVWAAATEEVPALRAEVQQIVADEEAKDVTE